MPEQFFTGLPYLLFATGVGLLGSVIALFWSSGANIRSAVQHFAAGAVLAAMAASVIPEVEHMGTFTGILGGFIAGGLVMIGLKWIVVRLERAQKSGGSLLNATLAVVLSFGAASLIYLIAEELLVETIEAEKSLFLSATLFAGFATLLALKLLGE